MRKIARPRNISLTLLTFLSNVVVIVISIKLQLQSHKTIILLKQMVQRNNRSKKI